MASRIVAGIVAVVFIGSQADAAKPSAALKKRIEFSFVDTALLDGVEILSGMTKVPIELDSKVAKDTMITFNSGKKLTLRQSLTRMLRPHKLTFRVNKSDTKITIMRRKQKK